MARIFVCPKCKKEFSVWHNYSSRKYCSIPCARSTSSFKEMLESHRCSGCGRMTGKNHICPPSTLVQRTCKSCKKSFHIWPAKIKLGGGLYCSRKCSVLKTISTKTRKLISASKLAELNPNWKGNNLSYEGKHLRMKTLIPKPSVCEKCKSVPPHDLANISQKYKLEISDWEWLCRKCHMLKDNRLKKMIERNKTQTIDTNNRKRNSKGQFIGAKD